MIQGTIKSCDFGMGIPDKSMFYLIELKGTDIKHATEQIKSAFEELHKKLSGIIFHARIVLSKTPRPHLQPSNYRELKVKFAKYNGTVESRSIFFNEDITQ